MHFPLRSSAVLLTPLLLSASLLSPTAQAQAVNARGSDAVAPASAGLGTPQPAAAAMESSSSVASLPDAPSADQTAHQDGQTKRILGIIPNFRAVSADVKLPPQSIREKFMTTTQDSFDYSTILLPGLVAGYSQATNATPEFHQGAPGYARYFWHSYLDQTVENYFVEFIGPVITRQDSRYYTLGKGGFTKRAVYSLSRVLITRNDAGKEVFNSSEVVGAAAASVVSEYYYPSKERTVGSTVGKWGQSVGIDAVTFLAKEFWPDINHHIFHGKADATDPPARAEGGPKK